MGGFRNIHPASRKLRSRRSVVGRPTGFSLSVLTASLRQKFLTTSPNFHERPDCVSPSGLHNSTSEAAVASHVRRARTTESVNLKRSSGRHAKFCINFEQTSSCVRRTVYPGDEPSLNYAIPRAHLFLEGETVTSARVEFPRALRRSIELTRARERILNLPTVYRVTNNLISTSAGLRELHVYTRDRMPIYLMDLYLTGNINTQNWHACISESARASKMCCLY